MINLRYLSALDPCVTVSTHTTPSTMSFTLTFYRFMMERPAYRSMSESRSSRFYKPRKPVIVKARLDYDFHSAKPGRYR